MEISLIRHGKSQFVHKGSVTLREFKQWVENYDFNGISKESICSPETRRKVTAANLVITSDLKRSIESAKSLNLQATVIMDSLFREIELPTGEVKGFKLKFNPGLWAVLLRILWFNGYSNKCESLAEARVRAKKAAQQLIDYTGEFESVALVGHGFFNRLIAKELQKKGWRGEKKLGAKHWNCITYFSN